MEQLDIVERLRGKIRVPVNDGAGLLDGKDFFERTFPTSKAAIEAADEIEKLRTQLVLESPQEKHNDTSTAFGMVQEARSRISRQW